MPTILLIGATGQLGTALKKQLKNIGNLYITEKTSFSLTDCPQIITKKLNYIRPQIIVNAAAYTNVEKAETESDVANNVNAYGPSIIARWAQHHHALLCHYSSDYVFDGKKKHPYKENDLVQPLSFYGLSKWLGEQAIISVLNKHLIFRISWVYSPYRHNFVKTILKTAHKKKEFFVVDDQIGTPTSADWIARTTTEILKIYIKKPHNFPFGLYHMSPYGTVSWFELTKIIFSMANKITKRNFIQNTVSPISTKKFSEGKILRPLNSQLNCNKLFTTFLLDQPIWLEDLEYVLKELLLCYL